MEFIEQFIINLLLNFTTPESLNAFLRTPQTTAILVGALVTISASVLGVFLLLRKMSMTSDAISHTVLLGIVVAFLVLGLLPGVVPDVSSPWLIVGATLSGVVTVFLTELIHRSGLVREDAALGLAFPFLFAIAVILISRFIDNAHIDADAVFVGEIGVAWANTNSHCLENCDEIVITPDHPKASIQRVCTNCSPGGIRPRDPEAVFEETCANCGTYTAAKAISAGVWPDPDHRPVLVFWPQSITVMLIITLLNLGFITLFYKELKLATFDSSLAAALGFRPGLLHYLLMALVSATAVGAFDAVGSILVIAFFIIPPAAAYLLTDRLWGMLVLSPIIGVLGIVTGYNLASGSFLGIVRMSDILAFVNRIVDLDGYTEWNTSISASMVIMTFFFFVVAWILSPRYGLISSLIRRQLQRLEFAEQLLLGHIEHHQRENDHSELNRRTLHEHLNWSPENTQRVLARLRARSLVRLEGDTVLLTERGHQRTAQFNAQNFVVV